MTTASTASPQCFTLNMQVRGLQQGVKQFLCFIADFTPSDLRFRGASCAPPKGVPLCETGVHPGGQGRAETTPESALRWIAQMRQQLGAIRDQIDPTKERA